jgi:chromate transporter
VLSFVGFLAAFRAPAGMDPLLAGVLGATLTTWVTFVPCFLWIFLGAPHIERLRSNRALSGALTAITAAVVGVILNLALWFGLHVLFRDVGTFRMGPVSIVAPAWTSIDVLAVALSVVAAVCLFRLRIGILGTLAICGGLGLLVALLFP